MSKPSDQQRILAVLQRHVEAGRIGLDDLTARLPRDELALLRAAPDAPWPPAARERLEGLVALGDGRRALGRETLTLLAIGFVGDARAQLLGLLERSRGVRLLARIADCAAQVREILERGGIDAALMDLRDSPGVAAARLARAELLRGDVPIVSVVGCGDDVPAGTLDAIAEDELDADALARALCEAAARHRTARALDAAVEKEHVAAQRDALTGLPSRAAFAEQLGRALHHAGRSGQQVAVLFVAVDAGEELAGLGGDVAESLVLTVAERLQGALRRSELIARVDGGEFLVMLQGRELDYAPARTAERLLESLTGAFVVDGHERVLAASIGIAIHPRDGAGPETLLRHADAALHQQKAEGGGGYRFYGLALSEVERRRHHIAERLRGALERGDLHVHYQPCVDASDGAIVGAEALLRWDDAELGAVSPAEFVPIAERAGLMCEIGSFVMREACRAKARWSAAGAPGVRVAVNVSAHQIHSASLRDAVVDGAVGEGLAPGSLEIELTESALVENPGAAAGLLSELAEIGVSLALDDFGTGFSALSHLRTFPVRTLKIDPSFVREIADGRPFPPFVQAILSLAEAIGLEVVAEGVETAAQRDALRARGCRRMQGFWFGRPMPEAEFAALLRSGRTLPAD